MCIRDRVSTQSTGIEPASAMTEYWVSEKKYRCEVCDIFLKDTKMSRMRHEAGEMHKKRAGQKMAAKRKQQQQEEMERRELHKELAEIDRRARSGYGKYRDQINGEPPPPSDHQRDLPEASGLLTEEAKNKFVEEAYQRAQAALAERQAAANAPPDSLAGLPPGFENQVPTLDYHEDPDDEFLKPMSIAEKWAKRESEADQWKQKVEAETAVANREAARNNPKDDCLEGITIAQEESLPENADVNTGLGQWQTVVRNEEGEDVDHVVVKKVSKRKLAQEAAGIVVHHKKEVNPLEEDVVDKAALAGLLPDDDADAAPAVFKRVKKSRPKSFRKKPA
eukprot:TRINITY_DN29716_c0_g1_i1.p1 TRINITY_DN29716_c0_g1~~TRINITY_DN29716_c0_g1_i1.p1  ORF type:complete len:336 (-),score=90.54 TRINITY_DN29716_c0_g1_i1:252-1259(-)